MSCLLRYTLDHRSDKWLQFIQFLPRLSWSLGSSPLWLIQLRFDTASIDHWGSYARYAQWSQIHLGFRHRQVAVLSGLPGSYNCHNWATFSTLHSLRILSRHCIQWNQVLALNAFTLWHVCAIDHPEWACRCALSASCRCSRWTKREEKWVRC